MVGKNTPYGSMTDPTILKETSIAPASTCHLWDSVCLSCVKISLYLFLELRWDIIGGSLLLPDPIYSSMKDFRGVV